MAIRTAGHLQAALDAERGWRIIELGAIRGAISTAVAPRKTTLLRAAVPLAYSHWEGFIKKSANSYGIYLSGRGLTYRDVKSSLIGVSALGLVNQLHAIERKISTASVLMTKLTALNDAVVKIDLWGRLADVGNLNFDLFMEIVEFLNFPSSHYSTKKAFIDESLVASRNKIAHGERVFPTEEEVKSLIDEVIILIDMFKADIEAAVSAGSFRR